MPCPHHDLKNNPAQQPRQPLRLPPTQVRNGCFPRIHDQKQKYYSHKSEIVIQKSCALTGV